MRRVRGGLQGSDHNAFANSIRGHAIAHGNDFTTAIRTLDPWEDKRTTGPTCVVIVGAQTMSRMTGVPTYIAEVIQGMSLMVMLIFLLFTEYKIKMMKKGSSPKKREQKQ